MEKKTPSVLKAIIFFLVFFCLHLTKAVPANAGYANCYAGYGIVLEVNPGYYTFENTFILRFPERLHFPNTKAYGVSLSCASSADDTVGNLNLEPDLTSPDFPNYLTFKMPPGKCSTVHKGPHTLTLKRIDAGTNDEAIICQDVYYIEGVSCDFSYEQNGITAPDNVKPNAEDITVTFEGAGAYPSFNIDIISPGQKEIGRINSSDIDEIGNGPNNDHVKHTIKDSKNVFSGSEGWYTIQLWFYPGRVTWRKEVVCEGPLPVSTSPDPLPGPGPGAVSYKPCESINELWKEENDAAKKQKLKEEYTACLECMSPSDPNKKAGVWTALGCIAIQPAGFITTLLKIGFGVGGGVAFLFLIQAAFQMLTSEGDPKRVESARQTITAAITGLLLIIFSVIVLKILGYDILRLPGFESCPLEKCTHVMSADDCPKECAQEEIFLPGGQIVIECCP